MATTKTWNANHARSWRTTSGWRTDNNDVYQGQYSSYGRHKGLWFFDDANVRSTLAGQSILSMRLRLTRRSGGGSSSSQTPTIRHHNYSSQPSSEPSLSSANVTSQSWGWGDTKWVTLTTAWGAPLRDGLIRGFGLYIAADNPYMIFSPTATLEITYEPELDPPNTPSTPWITALSQTELTLRTNTPANTETWEWNPSDAGSNYAVREAPEYVRSGSPGVTYYIRVRARNSAGVSSYSAYRTILMLPPNPPTPTVDAIGETSVSLSVPAQTGTSGYDWQRSTTTLVTGGSRTQVFGGLSPDTTYSFRVRSRNSSGVSSYSSYRTVRTLLPVPATPSAPTGSVLSETSVSVQWDAVAYAESYDLRANGSIVKYETTSRDHTITGLSDGNTYAFTVRAKNTSGTSAYSDDLTLITPSLYVAPETPTGVGPTGLVGAPSFYIVATLAPMSSENDGLTQRAEWRISPDPDPYVGGYIEYTSGYIVSGTVSKSVPPPGTRGTGTYYLHARAVHSEGGTSPFTTVEFFYTRVKVWNGSTWVLRPVYVYDGSAWSAATLKVQDYWKNWW